MLLYEVVYYGSNGDANAEDTLYLVKAPDFQTAVAFVQRNSSPRFRGATGKPAVVHEIGLDFSGGGDPSGQIIRGPYFASAYNFGWRAWNRKWGETDYTDEWEETINRGVHAEYTGDRRTQELYAAVDAAIMENRKIDALSLLCTELGYDFLSAAQYLASNHVTLSIEFPDRCTVDPLTFFRDLGVGPTAPISPQPAPDEPGKSDTCPPRNAHQDPGTPP